MDTMTIPLRFSSWRTITLGIYDKTEELRRALTIANCGVSRWASDIFNMLPPNVYRSQTDVDIGITTAAELGFGAEAPYRAICARANTVGLQLCPAELGPMLRLQYADQPPAHLHVFDHVPAQRGDRFGHRGDSCRGIATRNPERRPTGSGIL